MPPKFIRPEELEVLAQRFLAEHHASLEPPVPIEEIVEFGLGLDVVPLPNLYRDFQIESWLSHDTRSIFVDLHQCEEMETRYRGDVLAWFKSQAHKDGGGSYQVLINRALREHMKSGDQPLEELPGYRTKRR